jgi:hypothetical protein
MNMMIAAAMTAPGVCGVLGMDFTSREADVYGGIYAIGARFTTGFRSGQALSFLRACRVCASGDML